MIYCDPRENQLENFPIIFMLQEKIKVGNLQKLQHRQSINRQRHILRSYDLKILTANSLGLDTPQVEPAS